MSSFSELMFTTVPLIALIANIFLFFTLVSAKKDSTIYSFMGLLGAFILWSGGSYLMRMQFLPGSVFWWKISLVGIFLVPYMYYLLLATYLERRGVFLKILWGILSFLMAFANLFDFFMTSPTIKVTGETISSEYSVKWTAIFAIVIAVAIFASIFWVIGKAMQEGTFDASYLTPLFIGVGIMIVGIAFNMIPMFTSYPTDTLACAVNAIFIYYALYKKRLYAMSQLTSSGSVFVVSLIIASFVTYQSYHRGGSKLELAIGETKIDLIILVVVFCSVISIALYILLNKLHSSVFVRERIRREDKVRDFSNLANATLNMEEILKHLDAVVKEEIPVSHMYFCLKDEERGGYVSGGRLQNLEEHIFLANDHPLVRYIEKKNKSFMYADFLRTPYSKSLHEDEKAVLLKIQPTYIMLFISNDELNGFAILAAKENGKDLSFAELSYLDAAASVASIAVKNALLYEKLEAEAQIDGLTGLLNRRAFVKKVSQMTEEQGFQAALIMFNMDDFGLYNELYGNGEGDILLQGFAGILRTIFGTAGIVARYGGNEYTVLLPHTDISSAVSQAERVQAALSDFINGNGERTKKFLTFSAGICTYPAQAGNVNQLLTYANMAVFKVKQHGKNDIGIYNEKDSKQKENSGAEELLPTIYALTAAIDAKDHYTFNHSRCVSEYASQLAFYAGLGEDMVEIIRQAGLLHDIGKIGIPDAILTKTDKLTNDEYAIMKQHVERSIDMIRHLPALDYVIPAVLGHHERFDGRGYPRGIIGADIPVSARCLTIADAFDAMISKRSYKNKMKLEDALGEIERNLGTQFDPELGRLFIELINDGRIQVIPY